MVETMNDLEKRQALKQCEWCERTDRPVHWATNILVCEPCEKERTENGMGNLPSWF